MGLSWSKRRRRHDNHHLIHPPTSSSNTPPPFTLPPPTPVPPQQPSPPPTCNPTTYAFAANAPHSPSPYPPPLYNFSGYYPRPVHMTGHYNYRPYYVPQISGWGPSAAPLPPVQPAPYVDHQSAKKVKNDVNVHNIPLGFNRMTSLLIAT